MENVVQSLSALLKNFWNSKMRSETACDYEHLLPYAGRFDGRKGVPIVYDKEIPDDLDPLYKQRLKDVFNER